MDGLVEELLRLEGVKHKALIEIDAAAYDATVREQMRLVAVSRNGASAQAPDVERLLALSQLITLNTRLLQTLVSTTPWFAFNQNGYTPDGQMASAAGSRGVVLEA
jgi:hypothetical protein